MNIKVIRPAFARMKAQDVEGNWREFEGRDLLARCYLHELDHLNGVPLLIDKMSMLQKMNWRRALRQLEEDRKNRKPAK